MKIITSRDNAVFKELRGLAQDPREIRKRGATLLDGPHLVGVYRDRVGLPKALAVSESGWEKPEIQQLLERHRGVEPLLVKDSLFKEVSPSQSPVGIVAVIDIPVPQNSFLDQDVILLDGLQDPGNVGTILRSAAAFGITSVYLGNGSAGAWTPKVLRAGQGAHFSLDIHERVELADVVKRFPGRVLATVVDDAESLYCVDLHKPVAWLIGNEGQGVNPSLADACHHRVTIPITSDCESLNAAVATSICLAEMVRQRGSERGPK